LIGSREVRFSSWGERLRLGLLEACARVEATNACVHTRSHDGQYLLCQAVTSGFRPTLLAHGLELSGCLAIAEVLRTGQPLAIDDAEGDERVASVARKRYGLQSVLYQPLGDSAVAIFSHQVPHAWTAAEVAAAAASVEDLRGLLANELGSGRAMGEQLSATEARLRAMLSTAGGIVAAVDCRGIVYEASMATRGALLSPSSLLDHIRSGPRGSEMDRVIAELFRRERVDHDAVLIIDDDPIHVRLQAYPERPDAPVEGLLISAHPVAEIYSAVSLLRDAERNVALGRISAAVAHEFNTVLQIIDTAADSIRERQEASGVASIEAAVERGARLVRQLLAFAEPRAAARVPVDLGAAVQDMRPLLARAVGSDHALRMEVTSVGVVEADLEQLRLALVILCLNARDASSPGQHIDVTVSDAIAPDGRAHARIQVTDRGVGMTSEVYDRAFKPFFSTKSEGRGTGLGLSTVRAVVSAHGGQILVNTAPGAGTRVRIELPVVEGAPAIPLVPPAPVIPVGLAGARVLVVEDEALIGQWAQRVLAASGAQAKLVPSVSAALAALQSKIPDVLLLDMLLGDGHGASVLDAVKDRMPPSAIVIATGYAAADLMDLAKRGHRLLEKPYRREGLLSAVGAAFLREAR